MKMLDRFRLVTVVVAIAGLFPLAGCFPEPSHARAATLAELGPVPSGSAQVCVLRPDSTASYLSMLVRDNGRLVGATRGATFFCYLARTGDHQIMLIDDDTGPTFLRAQSGGRYWLHQDVTELEGTVHAHLDWVGESTALEMLDACDERVYVWVPGRDDEKSPQPIAPARSSASSKRAKTQPTASSSTSKTSVEPGGITGGKPRSP